MDMSKYMGSFFLKVEDVEEGPRRVRIVKIETGQYDKPVATFDDNSRLSLNVTNSRALGRAFARARSALPAERAVGDGIALVENVNGLQQLGERIADKLCPVLDNVRQLAAERIGRCQGRGPQHINQVQFF